MEQDHKIKLHTKISPYPLKVRITWDGHSDEIKNIMSSEEMKNLLEEVKLYNSENSDKKRIISI